MSIVTIRGHMGSGAQEIGRQVAERLRIDYIDREVIARVAELLNERSQAVMAKETLTGSLLERIGKALGFDYSMGASYTMDGGFVSPYSGAYLPTWQMPLDDNRYLAGLESVIKELAREQSAVICGRGSQFILKDHPDTLHVLVVAPFETRVNRVLQSMSLDRESAEKEIARSDGSRREFVKRYFQADMEDAVHYDMVINTEHLSLEQAASLILNTLPFKAGRRGR